MRQAGGSAATIYSSGGMPVQSAVLNSGTIATIENADLNSGTIPLLRGAFVPRDFGTAIEGVSLLRVPLLGTIDCSGFVFTTFVVYITTTMCDGVLLCLLFLMFFWCPYMAINVNVQYNGGFLPDIILLTQCYLHRGTCLNAMKRFCICSL